MNFTIYQSGNAELKKQVVAVPVPNIESLRELKRVGLKVFERVLVLLGKFPRGYQFRAASLFAKVYKDGLEKGAPIYKARNNGFAAINQKFAAIQNAVSDWHFPITALFDSQQREHQRTRIKRTVLQELARGGSDLILSYRFAATFLTSIGITPPTLKKDLSNLKPCLERMQCDEWIAAKHERSAKHARENLAIAWGSVGKFSPYVSKMGLSAYRTQKAKGEQFLAAFELVNDETGEVCELAAAAAAGRGNDNNKVIELNVRVDGLASWAERKNLEGYFLTLTAPSKYHYNSGKDWNGSTPRNTHNVLAGNWIRARAQLAKHGIDFRGLRVVEPHKDGTPHWHILFFAEKSQIKKALEIIKAQFCEEDKEELDTPKAERARFDAVQMQNAKHAARYVAKYISKNIDGRNMRSSKNESDYLDSETDLAIEDAAERVSAWKSLHSIRQFQFFGVASITLYREIRRLTMEAISEAARALVNACGGLKGDEINPNWYEFEKLAGCAELMKAEKRGRYGDAVKKVVGVSVEGEEFSTRVGNWIKERKREAQQGESRAAWKVVNNCNQGAAAPQNNQKEAHALRQQIASIGQKLKGGGVSKPQLLQNVMSSAEARLNELAWGAA